MMQPAFLRDYEAKQHAALKKAFVFYKWESQPVEFETKEEAMKHMITNRFTGIIVAYRGLTPHVQWFNQGEIHES